MENTEQQQQQQDSGKIQKKFDHAVHQLAAMLGGKEKLMASKRIPQDAVSLIIGELFEEERTEKMTAAKQEFKDILKKYREFTVSVAEKEKELKKLKDQKMEDFTKAAQSLLGRIDGLAQIEKSYVEGLKTAVSTSPGTAETEELDPLNQG